jgi:RNA polymerase sigma-70 factor (ECF subfamily)
MLDEREQTLAQAAQRGAENALVVAARRGDKAAFGELVDRLKRPVFTVCMQHVRNEADAMDLVQDTFLKAWTNLDTFKDGTNFRAWIYRIAANGAIDKLRRRKTRRADELDERMSAEQLAEGDLPSVGTFGRASPFTEQSRSQLGKRLAAALDVLPDAMRQCVILCDVHGYSYQEIADELGIPKGTVMSRLFYARKRLQEQLQDYRQEVP